MLMPEQRVFDEVIDHHKNSPEFEEERKRAERMARFISGPDYSAGGEAAKFDPQGATREAVVSGTSPIPIVGDIVGLGADLDMYANDPESRNWFN